MVAIKYIVMRAVLNISLPQKLKEQIEYEVKKGGYATKSEFLRVVMREWQENQILKSVQKSKAQLAKGEGKVLKSLKDLR